LQYDDFLLWGCNLIYKTYHQTLTAYCLPQSFQTPRICYSESNPGAPLTHTLTHRHRITLIVDKTNNPTYGCL